MFSLPLVFETCPRVLKLPLPTENLEKCPPLDFLLCAFDLSFPPSVCAFLFRSLPCAVRVLSVVVFISWSEDVDELSDSESELESDCQAAVFRAVGTWAVCPLFNTCRDCRGADTGLSVKFLRVRILGRGLDVAAGCEGSEGILPMAPEEAPPSNEGVRAITEALVVGSRPDSLNDFVRLDGEAKSIAL